MKHWLKKIAINSLVIAAVFAPSMLLAAIINTLPFNLTNGTTADATQVMSNFNQIVNNVNANAAKNGVNSDITALTALSSPISAAGGGSTAYIGSTSTGSANAQVVATLVPASFSLTSGNRVIFIAGFSNTGATTLNANGQGATNIFKRTPAGLVALTGGEIVSGHAVEAVYDGAQFELDTNTLSLAGPLTNLASASTADLGTISSHNINITGTTTITAFGSSASTTYPIYYLKFAGVLALTYNASSLILPTAANITTAANDTAVALYLGSGNWQIISYSPASGASLAGSSVALCGARNFQMHNNSGTPNTSIDMSADAAVMTTTSGVPINANSVAVTINTTVNGANGLDTGAKATSTWYNFYLINNGTTTAGLASLSATSPTMPGGYTFACRLGAMRTDGSGNFLRTRQNGNKTQYTVVASTNTPNLPVLATGTNGTWSATTPTWVSASVSNFVPPTAYELTVMVQKDTAAGSSPLIAPNNAYGGNGSSGSPSSNPPFWGDTSTSTAVGVVLQTTLTLESSSVFVVTGTNDVINVVGWRDSVPAY